MTPFYNDYDSLFERFSIMTVDGKLTDNEALQILRKHTTVELFQKLAEFVEKN